MHTHKLTLTLPDNLITEIDHFKDVTNEPSRSQAIIDLLKYALTLPPYFKSFDWQKAEEEADRDIAKGNFKAFSSAEDFLADLKK